MTIRDTLGRPKLNFGSGGERFIRGATFVSERGSLAPPLNDVFIEIPRACVIRGVRLFTSSVSGSCVVDIRRDSYGNFPPTNVDSICGGAKPQIIGGTKYEDVSLSGWQRNLNAGDVLSIVLESSTNFSSVVVQLILE